MQLKVMKRYHFSIYEINKICRNETSHCWEKYSGTVTFTKSFLCFTILQNVNTFWSVNSLFRTLFRGSRWDVKKNFMQSKYPMLCQSVHSLCYFYILEYYVKIKWYFQRIFTTRENIYNVLILLKKLYAPTNTVLFGIMCRKRVKKKKKRKRE